jgi:ribosomal protein L11 methyltransferase
MAQDWFQIKLSVHEESLKEALLNFLFEQGALGVCELEKPGFYLVSFEKKKEVLVCRALSSYLAVLKESDPEAEIQWEISPVDDDNWAEKYKEFYKAQKLTDRFFLRPRWDLETPIPSGMFPVYLDPGQAFGTGLHPSTRLSIKLLEDVAQLYPSTEPLSVLDVGTGTGILAIAAHHLGFGNVMAIDNDPDAVRVAKENLIFNQTPKVLASEIPIEQLIAPFDIIVANILLETHLLLFSHYQRLLKPGGLLILAGLLGGQIQMIEGVFQINGFTPQQKYWLQEWAACSYTHRDPMRRS